MAEEVKLTFIQKSKKHWLPIGLGVAVLVMGAYIFWPQKKTIDNSVLEPYLQRITDSLLKWNQNDKAHDTMIMLEVQRLRSALNNDNQEKKQIIIYRDKVIDRLIDASVPEMQREWDERYPPEKP